MKNHKVKTTQKIIGWTDSVKYHSVIIFNAKLLAIAT